MQNVDLIKRMVNNYYAFMQSFYPKGFMKT